ncbi:hypothetical protein [Kaarinaea lacus]
MTLIIALTGYLAFVLPVFMFAYGIYLFCQLLAEDFSITTGLALLVALAIGSTGAYIAYSITRIKYPSLKGLPLTRANAGKLYSTLDDICAQYPWLNVEEIFLTNHYEMRLHKKPVMALPFWSHNTLCLGIPLLLTMLPEDFHCLLNREITHHSKKRNPVTTWLNQLQDFWLGYQNAFKNSNLPINKLYAWFFRIYSPVYRIIVKPIGKINGLNADRNALDNVSSDDLLHAIENQFIMRHYLEHQFWPNVIKMAQHNLSADIGPYKKLFNLAQKTLNLNETKQWLEREYASIENDNASTLTLKQRMDNLGISKVKTPKPISHNAAHYYFAEKYESILKIFDNLWLQQFAPRATLKHVKTAVHTTSTKAVHKTVKPKAPSTKNNTHTYSNAITTKLPMADTKVKQFISKAAPSATNKKAKSTTSYLPSDYLDTDCVFK